MPKLSFLLKQKWAGSGDGFKSLAEQFSKEAYSETGLKYLRLAVNRWKLVLVSKLVKSVRTRVGQESGQLEDAFSVHTKVGTVGRGAMSTEIDVEVRIDENKAPYAMLHEEGGTVTAAAGGYLTIPTPFIRERVGAAKKREHFWASKMMQEMGDKIFIVPRYDAETRIAMLRRTGGRTKNSGAIPAFILKKTVTIPARPWIQPGIDEAIGEFRRIMEGIGRQYLGG